MNNLHHTPAVGGTVAENDESLTINADSSGAMILPAGAENQNEDDDIWNWVSGVRLEEFDTEDLEFLTLQKPPEPGNNAYQSPSEFGKHANPKLPMEQFLNPNEAKFNTAPPELRSLIKWQNENVGYIGEVAMETKAQGKAPLDNDISIISLPVDGDATGNNRKRKGKEVDDNYENNARVRRRGGSRTSEAIEYETRPGRKSTYSINDKLMALHELVPGSKKADLATTLGETVEYLKQVKIRDYLLTQEVKQLREAMNMIRMHSGVHRRMNHPIGTPLNMGGSTQLGGLESRPWGHPRIRMFNYSSVSARMNEPSVMPSLLQSNSTAPASRLFLPPQLPAPSQQQRTPQDKVLHNELFVFNEVVMKDVYTDQESVFNTRDTKFPQNNQLQINDTQGM